MKSKLLCSLLGLFLGACASYTPSSAPVPEPTAAEWIVDGNYAVSTDVYADTERQKAIFDADFNEADVIAVQVVVENRGPRVVLVRPSDMILTLPDEQSFSPSGYSSVVNKVGESGSVVGASLAFGIIGAIAATSAEDEARTGRTADYKEKSFRDSELRQDEAAHGFAFFIPPRGTAPFDTATLRVRFVDFDTASSEFVEVPLGGIGYEETKKDKAEQD